MSTPVIAERVQREDPRTALASLVSTGELTQSQADHVVEALATWAAEPPTPPLGHGESHAGWVGRVAEVGAYLGAALLASGAALIVRQQWRDLERPGQLALLAGLVVVFATAGLVVAAVRDRAESARSGEAVLRRLSSTLLVLATAALGGLVIRLFVPDSGSMESTQVGWLLLVMGAACGLSLVGVRLVVPSALAEMALFACVLLGVAGVLLVLGEPDRYPGLATVPVFVVGLGWAAIAMTTRLLTVPQLGVTLGLFASLWACTGGDATTAKVMLALLAVICFAVYLVRPAAPWIVVALVAAVAFTMLVVGEAFNPAVGLVVAGLVLLALAGTAFVVQHRRAQVR